MISNSEKGPTTSAGKPSPGGRVARGAAGPEMTFPDRLKRCRVRAGLSIRAVARLSYVAPTTLQNYEAARSLPGVGELRKLSEVFGVSTDYLVFGDERAVRGPDAAGAFFNTPDPEHYLVLVGMAFRALPLSDRLALEQVVAALLSATIGDKRMAEITAQAHAFLHFVSLDASPGSESDYLGLADPLETLPE